MDNEELKKELISSLPNLRMYEITSNLAIQNPFSDDLIFLKRRAGFENIPLSQYIRYNEIHNIFYSINELIGKFVIVDYKLLTKRGINALITYYNANN